MATTTIGIFTDKEHAKKAIGDLLEAGIQEEEISYVYMNEDGNVGESEGQEKKPQTGKAVGTGAVLGGLAGLALATGVIPGLGAVALAGPIAQVLGLTGAAATAASGALVGAVGGGIIGALVELGINRDDAQLYEERLRKGDVIVLVSGLDEGVSNILKKHHTVEVREYAS